MCVLAYQPTMPNGSRSPMERWVAVLDAFTTRDEWGVRELAGAVGLSPTATHRMLHEMARTGLLASAVGRGQFRVGPELTRLAVLTAHRLDVRRVARPILEATADAIDETVILALYSPSRRRFWAVDAAEAGHTIRYIWESLRPWSDLHRGASGKGILAFLPEDEREAILDGIPEAERTALRAALDRARSAGVVISHGERFAGAIGVAAPIRDATGGVIGDLVAGWPDNRTDAGKEQRVAAAIVAAAGSLSRALGYRAATAASLVPTPGPARAAPSRRRPASPAAR